jgi:N-hydroxyarylamine O-acetyltransferase
LLIIRHLVVLLMEPTQYLERIGVDTDRESMTDIDHLARLQHHHLYTVPFTNLFVRGGDGTILHPDTVVPRIIGGGGGLCYDLNGAFAWLLTELGYDVSLVSARPMREDSSYGPEYDHLALLVEDHLVDVGFGDFARRPLPLDGNHHTDVSGTYRIFEDGDDGYAVQKHTDDSWEDTYRFSTTPRAPSEFAEMAEYHSTSTDSPFTGDLLVTLPTEDGRITLSDTTLTTTERGARRKRDVPPAQVESVLRDQFDLVA